MSHHPSYSHLRLFLFTELSWNPSNHSYDQPSPYRLRHTDFSYHGYPSSTLCPTLWDTTLYSSLTVVCTRLTQKGVNLSKWNLFLEPLISHIFVELKEKDTCLTRQRVSRSRRSVILNGPNEVRIDGAQTLIVSILQVSESTGECL